MFSGISILPLRVHCCSNKFPGNTSVRTSTLLPWRVLGAGLRKRRFWNDSRQDRATLATDARHGKQLFKSHYKTTSCAVGPDIVDFGGRAGPIRHEGPASRCPPSREGATRSRTTFRESGHRYRRLPMRSVFVDLAEGCVGDPGSNL